MSVEYVKLSAVAKVVEAYPPVKYPFVPSPEHPANKYLAWLRFALV